MFISCTPVYYRNPGIRLHTIRYRLQTNGVSDTRQTRRCHIIINNHIVLGSDGTRVVYSGWTAVQRSSYNNYRLSFAPGLYIIDLLCVQHACTLNILVCIIAVSSIRVPRKCQRVLKYGKLRQFVKGKCYLFLFYAFNVLIKWN